LSRLTGIAYSMFFLVITVNRVYSVYTTATARCLDYALF